MKKTNGPFFAAANGYSGFRSYFSSIFDSRLFDKVFVLKGGPGTGKNTLMKKIACLSKEDDISLTEYYCSSDPSSLDAIILTKNNREIGILDGTSPHERDAVYPGAIDRIINLGCNFREDILEQKRKEILQICGRKSNAYRQGYLYLSIAGLIDEKIQEKQDSLLDSFRETAISLLPNSYTDGNETVSLKTAFCHLGFITLPSQTTVKTLIKIDGVKEETYSFMEILRKEIKRRKMKSLILISPLSDNKIDAVFFEEVSLLITRTDTPIQAENRKIITLQASDYVQDNQAYVFMHADCLRKAQECFSEASRAHFELEEIYKSAMDYRRNEALSESLCTEIAEILSKP